MKKIKIIILLAVFSCILILTGKIAVSMLEKLSFWNRLEKKYFATIINAGNNKKIVIYNKNQKVYEFPAGNALAILSIENGRMFYLKNDISYEKNAGGTINENSRKESNFIVEYDIKNKRTLKKKSVNIFFDWNIPYIKKIGNKLFFSRGSYLDSTDKAQENTLYEYDMETENIKEVLKYNGQGLPVIREDEIVYSKENRIYVFDRVKNTSEYLFEGELPFDYSDDKVYYMNDNDIVRRHRGAEKAESELIYRVKDDVQIGGYPLRIDNELFIIIELEWIPLDKAYTEYSKLMMINAKNKMKLDIYRIYYKKETAYPLLTNDMFIVADRGF